MLLLGAGHKDWRWSICEIVRVRQECVGMKENVGVEGNEGGENADISYLEGEEKCKRW